MQLFRKLLFPFSLLYAVVVYLRNWFFDIGLFRSKSYKKPIICIGNLSTGGTGKTPMIEVLLSLFTKTHKIAVLSRGYGRKSDGFLLATKNSTVEELGDEPYQIYSKFPEITMVVDADRQNGIASMESKSSLDFILLDDGFQHRKVTPGFSILLTTYDKLYVDDWYLPTGNLRDSKKEAKRASIIIVTKCPDDLSNDEQLKIKKRLHVHPNQEVLFTYFGYNSILKGNFNKPTLETLKNKKITLVTGIANPKPLENYLSKLAIQFEHLKYKDHHFFTDSEIKLLQSKECIITTEKDYVRLKDKVRNLSYIEVTHRFLNKGEEELTKQIESYLSRSR
ncbi:lipid-A-disaccharide kinase [Maribacter vaceletii]|uniref:Tetraacyldisaccharide 4'-kinase n=1 Tax=Maribacter vaceletii TaxID=1206816 RepID=A0A495DSF9_9FLAO|nr:tetraacyldisaccharide 4'-kinase [Maribacter vaceletii]RKR06974.1 lipid-A-disaccharide kinase [Maribacter vaceletii]